MNGASTTSRSTSGTAAGPTPEFDYSATRLDSARRSAELDRLAAAGNGDPAEFDLVVIGAGITGAGIALDAATRGLSVLIVDAHDFAFGTSRWSSKLAHGGLRYLATGNVGIAVRSARERGTLMETTAPHLTHALAQVVPVQDRYSLLNRVLPRAGFLAGDFLRMAAGTSSSTLPRSRVVSAARVRELCPTAETSDLRFGYVNYDGQLIDDARLVTAIIRTAAGYGATVLNHVRAEAESGTGVVLRDTLDPGRAPVSVSAKSVVNATGVWAGDLAPEVTVTPSRGTHLVIDAERVGNPAGALTVPVPGATNRFCFVLPEQLGRCYIGLTDVDQPGEIPDVPAAPEEDVQWILDVINQAMATDLEPADVRGAFAGLRPLISLGSAGDGEGGDTADLSREHAILVDDSGLVTITGGKLTEYRLMAEQTVDKAIEVGGISGAGHCVSANTPIVGAPKSAACRTVSKSDVAGLPESLVARFGYEAPAVVRASTLLRPLEPVAPGIDITRAEFAFHASHEGALDESDLLDRRSRIGLVDADREACVPAAREALAAAKVADAE
ncbi:glycerol-3-phosphate dehydrogenase/oxidase [Dietzia sp.]|uniref:glycerol-3-phosphate dehydrogenase/oxidase n=1 Tax=Dietzia sp. TaxID=1871616 RepID=UPI002FDB0D52